MKGSKKTYSTFRKVSSVLMILALLWLTVSIPFVYAGQQKLQETCSEKGIDNPFSGNEEESGNPLGSTTEEKAPSGSAFSEEYLHDHHIVHHFFFEALQFHKCENAGTYIAFHGELLVPPPNAIQA